MPGEWGGQHGEADGNREEGVGPGLWELLRSKRHFTDGRVLPGYTQKLVLLCICISKEIMGLV